MVGWLRHYAARIPNVHVWETDIEEWVGFNPIPDMEREGYLVAVGRAFFPARIVFFGRSRTQSRFWYVFISPWSHDTLMNLLGKFGVERRFFEYTLMPETISRVRLSLFLKLVRYHWHGSVLPECHLSRAERRIWLITHVLTKSRFEF